MIVTASQLLTEKLLEFKILAGVGIDIDSTSIHSLADETSRSLREKILRGKDISWEGPSSFVYPITLGRGVTLSAVLSRWDELSLSIQQFLPDTTPSLTKFPPQVELVKPLDQVQRLPLHPGHLKGWPKYQAIVGVDLVGSQYVGFNLDDTAHTLIAGTTGSGKTTLAQTAILSMAWNQSPEELELYLIDLKNSGIKDLETLPHVRGVATEGHTAASIIRYVRDRLKERNANREKNPPWILLVIDELAVLARCGIQDLFEVSLTSIGQLGRERHVGIIAGTQKVDSTVLPTQLTQQFNTTFLGRVKMGREGTALLGVSESGATYLPIKVGAFLMTKPSLMTPVRLTAFYPDIPRWLDAIQKKYPREPQLIDFTVPEEDLTGVLVVGNQSFDIKKDAETILMTAQQFVTFEGGRRTVKRGGYSRMSEDLRTTYGGSTIPRIAAALDYLEKENRLCSTTPTSSSDEDSQF